MTSTFERFLRALSDDELAAFARDRARVGPPYWRLLRVALRIEADRRGLALDEEPLSTVQDHPTVEQAHSGTA